MVSASPDPTAAASRSLMRSSSSISASVMRSVAADGQFPGDRGLQPEDVLDVLPGQRQHDVAAVRFQLHHALAAQFQQGLAHRGDAHPEFGRGLVEPDERSRAQRPRHDRRPQVARDLVGQLCPAQRTALRGFRSGAG